MLLCSKNFGTKYFFSLLFIFCYYYTQDEAINVVIDSFFNILLLSVFSTKLTLHFIIFSFVITIFFIVSLTQYTHDWLETPTLQYIFGFCVFLPAKSVRHAFTWKFLGFFHNFQLHNYYKFAFRSYTCLLKMLQLHLNHFEWFWSTNGPHFHLVYFCHIWAATVYLFLYSFERSTNFLLAILLPNIYLTFSNHFFEIQIFHISLFKFSNTYTFCCESGFLKICIYT